MEKSWMNNNLRTKHTDEISEIVIANCIASNETRKVANNKYLLTSRRKYVNSSVAADLAEWTDLSKKFTHLKRVILENSTCMNKSKNYTVCT